MDKGKAPVFYGHEFTVRDYFAAKAMQVAFIEGSFTFTKNDYDELSKVAYAISDAMLKERTK